MNDFEPPASPVAESTPRIRKTGHRYFLVSALLLMGLALLISWIPYEISQWWQAAAKEAQLQGDDQRALQCLEKAIAWSPKDAKPYVARSELYLKMKNFEASLTDAQKAVELTDGNSPQALYRRFEAYQRMRRHDKALRDADSIVELAFESNSKSMPFFNGGGLDIATALNLRAYARALAEREIDKGLEDINKAFDWMGNEDNFAMLDTRGYLRFLNGNLDGALEDMERSVQLAEDDYARFKELRSAVNQQIPADGVEQDAATVDQEADIDQLIKTMEEHLAVIYQHRALVYQSLGREEEAAQDFGLAEQYGYSPEDGIW